jgi:hypothetical protein
MDLLQAIESRKSVRAFSPREVPRPVLERIFAQAQRAPSWCNIQPWRVWVASGQARREVIAGLVKEAREGSPHPDVPFPVEYPEPYATHRRACGKALYEAMGIARDDARARQAAWLRNFEAFDAPHVAFVGIHRAFDLYGALDVGCWLQTVLLLARAEGIGTCAQASLSLYPSVVRRVLSVPDEVRIIFGIAMGYEDEAADANRCRTSREPFDQNVVFR